MAMMDAIPMMIPGVIAAKPPHFMTLDVQVYIPVAWSGNPSVMEIVAGCYAEGKGTEKNLAEASFWYERALRRGKPTMEDPAKNLDEKEKRELFSSKQKHILRLDAEAGAYEKQKSREGDGDVEVSKL